jgi:hypothetical protein
MAAIAFGGSACGGGESTAVGGPAKAVWVVGDGGVSGPEDDRVAAMIEEAGPGRLLYLGDVYETGTPEDFSDHYDPSFGRFKSITYPTPGNHEWPNRRQGYDRYWSDLLRRSGGRHYYSFDVGGWHFVSLNSEERIGPRSSQLAWLRRHLEQRGGNCTIAMVHSPRYTVGEHGYDESLAPAWKLLRGKAVAVLSGHDHNYQRMRPENGLTQFVVGTGGRLLYPVEESHWRLAASNDESFGALRLDLGERRADYAFISVDGRREDAGSLTCSRGRG